MSEKPSKNTSQDSKMFYRISKFFCKKPCGLSKRCYGASAGCASPPKVPCGEDIKSEFEVPPQEMKRVKSWSPDPEFMAQFKGAVMYPDAMTSKWKVPPYNRMVRPVERSFILRQVNWGPQHPAAHGALRLIIQLDGEVIRSAKPHIGLLHRGTEKLMEYHTYMQNLPYMDRLDYVSVMSCEQVYCLAVEKLLNIEVPLRAKFIRSMFAELSRLTNHFIAMASNILDFGAITPFFWMCEEREKVYEFCERASGSRMHSNYFRVGGVAQDIPMGLMEDIYDFASKIGERMDEVEDVCTHNRVFLVRTVGIGPMTADEILNRGGTGIFLRAAGVKYDLRKQQPYDAYEHLEFDVPIGRHGDVFDRYLCRVQEIRESAKIIAQCCNLMPPGEIKTDDAKVCPPKRAEMKTSMEALIHHFKYFTEGFSVPPGSAYAAVEGPKGEMGVYMVSDGSTKPYRCRLRTSGVAHLQAFGDLLEGQMLADIGGILGGLDVVFGEVDR